MGHRAGALTRGALQRQTPKRPHKPSSMALGARSVGRTASRPLLTVEAFGLPPFPTITTAPSAWHPLNGPPELRSWCEAAIKAGAFAASAIQGFCSPAPEDDHGSA